MEEKIERISWGVLAVACAILAVQTARASFDVYPLWVITLILAALSVVAVGRMFNNKK